jgi:hypothetical protein
MPDPTLLVPCPPESRRRAPSAGWRVRIGRVRQLLTLDDDVRRLREGFEVVTVIPVEVREHDRVDVRRRVPLGVKHVPEPLVRRPVALEAGVGFGHPLGVAEARIDEDRLGGFDQKHRRGYLYLLGLAGENHPGVHRDRPAAQRRDAWRHRVRIVHGTA